MVELLNVVGVWQLTGLQGRMPTYAMNRVNLGKHKYYYYYSYLIFIIHYSIIIIIINVEDVFDRWFDEMMILASAASSNNVNNNGRKIFVWDEWTSVFICCIFLYKTRVETYMNVIELLGATELEVNVVLLSVDIGFWLISLLAIFL